MILPILDPNWATDKMVDAVLRNKAVLLLPRILYIFLFIKSTFSTAIFHTMARFFGVNSSMDEFKGRTKKDN